MRLKETYNFSRKRYHDKKADDDNDDIKENIYAKRRNLISAKTSVVTGVLCVPVTAGASLLGVAYQLRNISVEKRKLAQLDLIWTSEREQEPLQHRPFKDKWLPMFITSLIGCFIFNVDLGISNASATAAYAAQQGLYGYDFNAHAVGAYYDGVEKVIGTAGNKVVKANANRE